MGGFVYQEIDGTRFPIIFLSKSFDTTQQRWSVPEKECYAIWFTLRRLEHLLRDVPFTLHTYHKNLTYFATTGSAKVLRWKLEVQEYDCKVQYITAWLMPYPDSAPESMRRPRQTRLRQW